MIDYIKFSPLLISRTINHYLNGPPRPSWDLKFHLTWAMFKSIYENTSAKTIEQMQIDSFCTAPVPAGMMINEFKINNNYRYEAQVHLEKILKPYEHVLDTEWKNLKDDGINTEWVQVPNDGWEKKEIRKTILYLHGGGYYLFNKESRRSVTSYFAKKANTRVLGKLKLGRIKFSINL
jgi:acetyl esterase/lipase